MPALSKLQQQQQQLASRNETHSSSTRVRGLTFFSFALESYGYLDTQAWDYIRHTA
jgi:hypothetical protein